MTGPRALPATNRTNTNATITSYPLGVPVTTPSTYARRRLVASFVLSCLILLAGVAAGYFFGEFRQERAQAPAAPTFPACAPVQDLPGMCLPMIPMPDLAPDREPGDSFCEGHPGVKDWTVCGYLNPDGTWEIVRYDLGAEPR